MNKKTILAIAFVAVLQSTNVSADLITFDEIHIKSWGSVLIDEGYHGFNWDNFYVVNGKSSYPRTGYEYGTVSPSNAAFNGDGDVASISSSFYYFDLISMYITKAWHGGWTHFDGFIGDTLTYSMDVYADTRTPDLITFNWTGLTKITMSDGNISGQTVIDNMVFSIGDPIPEVPDPTISSPVPELQGYVMLLAGIGLLGFITSNRKKSL